MNAPSEEIAAASAIVWVPGGFEASIGADLWADAPADNDQTARAFREAAGDLVIDDREVRAVTE